jgi:hypothetical protein
MNNSRHLAGVGLAQSVSPRLLVLAAFPSYRSEDTSAASQLVSS